MSILFNEETDPHYAAIKKFYGDRKASRSQVPLIKHIDDGIKLLRFFKASEQAIQAYCIHPLLQNDPDLIVCLNTQWLAFCDPRAVAVAMEYRATANAYLSHHCKADGEYPALSVIKDVNWMLIADKIQNRKDFELHHKGIHKNSKILDIYFKNWLHVLGIDETRYQYVVKELFE